MNKKYIQTGENTFKLINDKMREEWRKINDEREKYFKNNVKTTRICTETGVETVINDPFKDRLCDDD